MKRVLLTFNSQTKTGQLLKIDFHFVYACLLILSNSFLLPNAICSPNMYWPKFGETEMTWLKSKSYPTANVSEIIEDSRLFGIEKLVNPYYQTAFGRKRVKADHNSVVRFIADFDKSNIYELVYFKAKKKKVTEIIVLNKEKRLAILNFRELKLTLKSFRRRLGDDHPAANTIYKSVLEHARTQNTLLELIESMPKENEEIIEYGYERYFLFFTSVKEAYRGFNQIAQKEDKLWTIAAKGAARQIKSEDDLEEYFKYFKGWADEEAYLQAARVLSCERVIKLLNNAPAYVQGTTVPLFEHIYALGCMNSIEDFRKYLIKYPNGKHKKESFEKALTIAQGEGRLFDFMEEYRHVVNEMPGVAKKYAFQEIKDVKSTQKIC